MDSSSPAKHKLSVFSSSSPSIPCRQNPKSRNSETGDMMRRSFRGNPFPADSSRRNSIGNRVDYGDKENQSDKDQILNVSKASKSAKNFMSPTISAVSKINPSPRKRILSDKNEVSRSVDKTHHHQVRSSVSFSDVVSIIGEEEDKDHHEPICIDEKKKLEEESHDITVTDIDENLEKKSNDDDSSSFKISPHPPRVSYTFPVFESQEVDPSLTPYDPKKNYLSPRPQFLHYRPNPRIEHRSDERKQLEELFTSESSSCETDLSAEESQQEEEVASLESVVAAEEETRVEDCEEEEEEEKEVVGESIEEETHQISTQSSFKRSKLLGWLLALCVGYLLLVSSSTLSQPNITKDSLFFEFHISPEIIKSARESFEELSVKLRMWTEPSLVYLDKLISSLREEERFGSFQFYNLTDTLEGQRLSDSVFKPASGESNVASLFMESQDWSFGMDIEGENVGHQEPEESENGGEISFEAAYEEDGNEIEPESKEGEVNYSEMDKEMEGGEGYSEYLSKEGNGGQEADGVEGQRENEENDQKNIEEGHESETRLAQNDEKDMEEDESEAYGGQETDGVERQRENEKNGHKNIEEGHEFETRLAQNEKNMEADESEAYQLDDVESAAVSGHQQKDTEVFNTETVSEEEGIVENSFDVSAEATDVEHDGNDLEGESGFGEVVNDGGSEEILLSNKKEVIVLFSTMMVLIAAAAAASFLLAKKKAKPVMLEHEDGEPTTVSDTKEVNIEHAPVENLMKERFSSPKFQEEKEVDDGRKREVSSLPSEMSFSFHKHKPFHSCNNRDDLKEYRSGEGGGRKSTDSSESMASSVSGYSIGSVSYGSFTTYEKVQKRSGHKEEEMITPVRRSNRIRNNQHSGQ